jgi:gamma-glutamyl-gamma-aminobutyrate hydrolase PuuD
MTEPRIAITRWEDVPGERLQFYWDRVREAGADVVDLSTAEESGFDGLILTGGIDIDPACYGEERHPKVRHTDPRRDQFELAALRKALDADMPVLAICRGYQLLNVALGGTLLQHIEGDGHRAHKDGAMPSRWHTTQLQPGSRLSAAYGVHEMEVNSRHHQAVLPGMLASDLRAVAFSPDGIVEAVESARHSWVAGVQWHPERPEPEHPGFAEQSRAIFQAFVAATRNVREPV